MAREREAVLKKLSTSQRLATELEQAHERAQAQCEQVQGQLNQAQGDRQDKVGELAETVGNVTVDLACKLDTDKNLKELRQEAATKLGISEPAPQDLAGLVGELGRLPGLARATWRLLAERGRTWVWAFGCLAAFSSCCWRASFSRYPRWPVAWLGCDRGGADHDDGLRRHDPARS